MDIYIDMDLAGPSPPWALELSIITTDESGAAPVPHNYTVYKLVTQGHKLPNIIIFMNI